MPVTPSAVRVARPCSWGAISTAQAQPERAKALRATYSAWNVSNVPCRLLSYTDYHKKRDVFFSGAIPDAAKDGYVPKVKANFK